MRVFVIDAGDVFVFNGALPLHMRSWFPYKNEACSDKQLYRRRLKVCKCPGSRTCYEQDAAPLAA